MTISTQTESDLAPGAAPNRYLEDIHGEPETLRTIARVFTGEQRQTLAQVRQWFWRGEHRLIVFTGMGASLFAAQAVVPSLDRIGVRAVAADASELLHYGIPSLAGKVAVVIISQSGESPEVRGLVKALKGRVDILGIVRNQDSFLSSTADLVVPVPAEEDGGVAVRSYTGTVAVLLLLSHVLAGGVVDQAAAALERATEGMVRALDQAGGERIADLIDRHSIVHLVGRGPSLGSALEGALLFKEGAKFQAEGLSSGQLRHGSVEVIEEGHVSLVFAPRGSTFELQQRLVGELASYGSRVAVLTNARAGSFPEASAVIHVQAPDEAYAPLVEIVPIQLAVYTLATRLGRAPGVFRNTSPLITEE